MTPTELGILVMAVPPAALIVSVFTRRYLQRRQRDFTRTLETVLLPRESVKAIYRRGRNVWILTSRRLLLKKREGFHAIALEKIKSAQGLNAAGNRTSAAAKMVSLSVKADKAYTVRAGGRDFEAFVQSLRTELKKQKDKAKK